MIRKLPNGQFRLYSRKINAKTGKRRNLGTFNTRREALVRERQVQYFKHLRKNPIYNKENITLKDKIFEYIDKIERIVINFDGIYDLYEKKCEKVFDEFSTFLKYFGNDIIKIYRPKHIPQIFSGAMFEYENYRILQYLENLKQHIPEEESSEEATEYMIRVLTRLIELHDLIKHQYSLFFEKIKKCKGGKI